MASAEFEFARSAVTAREWLEGPLGPWVGVVIVVCFVSLVVAVAAKGSSEGRMIKVLIFHVGHEVPEWGCVVVVAYVRHDGCGDCDGSRRC